MISRIQLGKAYIFLWKWKSSFESKQEKETLRAAALGKFYEDYQPSNWGLLYEFIRITNDSEPVNEATDDSRVIDCGLSRKAKPTTLQTFFKSIDITEKHRILITILGLWLKLLSYISNQSF